MYIHSAGLGAGPPSLSAPPDGQGGEGVERRKVGRRGRKGKGKKKKAVTGAYVHKRIQRSEEAEMEKNSKQRSSVSGKGTATVDMHAPKGRNMHHTRPHMNKQTSKQRDKEKEKTNAHTGR